MLKIWIALISFIALASGCASSTSGPGAGTAASTVKGSVEVVQKRAREVFKDMNIQVTGDTVKNAGNERQLMGRKGDTAITVTINNDANSTSTVEVEASRNVMSGDRDLAHDILGRIVQMS